MNIFYKIHEQGNATVLAACDKELLGKVLEEGDLHFEVRESFYRGEEADAEKLKELVNEHNNINLIGEKVVGVVLEENLITDSNIIRIKNVPHVQIFKI